MRRSNKKLLEILACATALSGGIMVSSKANLKPKVLKVKAARSSVSPRSYGVDVASYQSTNLNSMAKSGGQFAIVKVTEGTSYQNPKAAAQIKSAINNNMLPMAYHFATFGANKNAAINEANYAIATAKSLGLPKGAYIACDWEAGQGNNISAGKNPSATAILAFMKQVKAAGFQPLLYSSASWLNNNINTKMILAQYPNSLWVASYATMGRIDTANFNYFPSMDGVAIWQFTDNWRGLNVDGNISLLPLSMNSANSGSSSNTAKDNISQAAKTVKNKTNSSSKSVVRTNKKVMHSAAVYNQNGQRSKKVIRTYAKVTILGGIVQIKGRNYYKIGDNQYLLVSNIDGTKTKLRKNAYTYTGKGIRMAIPLIKKDSVVTVYGGQIKIAGKNYYRVGVGRYIKVGNF